MWSARAIGWRGGGLDWLRDHWRVPSRNVFIIAGA
jgi:hypothetical protein